MSTTVEPHIVSIAEIRDAAERIRGVATRTPLLRWDDATWLKPESLQPVGAFKMRGAYNKVASLTDAERGRGRRHVLLGQPRTGRGARRTTARRQGGHLHARERAAGEGRGRPA